MLSGDSYEAGLALHTGLLIRYRPESCLAESIANQFGMYSDTFVADHRCQVCGEYRGTRRPVPSHSVVDRIRQASTKRLHVAECPRTQHQKPTDDADVRRWRGRKDDGVAVI